MNIFDQSFPTHSGKRYVNVDMDLFWKSLLEAKESGQSDVEQIVRAALNQSCGAVDEDDKPLDFIVSISVTT